MFMLILFFALSTSIAAESVTRAQFSSPYGITEKLRPVGDKTLVIVNVEDTLKLAHVRNFWDSLNYVNDSKKRFMGMNSVLKVFARNNPGHRFVYLTQSPELIAGKTEFEFLKRNGFPPGTHRAYGNSDLNARVEILKNIVSEFGPKHVILLGHNGNDDVAAFHELPAIIPDVAFHTYVHIVYSTTSYSELGKALYPEQTGFVTSAELLVDWQLKGFIDFTEMVELSQSLIPRLLSAKAVTGPYEYSVPVFSNCDDFQWRWSVNGDYQFLTPLRDHLKIRCHMQAPLKKNQ